MYLGFYLWQKYMVCIAVVSKELLLFSPHINTGQSDNFYYFIYRNLKHRERY